MKTNEYTFGYSEYQLVRIKNDVNRAYEKWLHKRGFKRDVGFNPIYFKSRKNEDEQ